MKRYIVAVLAIALILSGSLFANAAGEVPGLINYQGKLTDELGVPVNREAEMTFSIYTEAAGGGPVWSESQDVQVTDGIFNVLLGSVNPLAPDYFAVGPETYLGVKIGEDSELAPRQTIVSTAYSLRSEISDGLSLDAQTTLLEVVYPVGSIYTSTIGTDPAVVFGFGTWIAFGAGRVPVGHNTGDEDFNSAEKTGGAKTHTLNISEMPGHTHIQDSHSHSIRSGYGDSGSTDSYRYQYWGGSSNSWKTGNLGAGTTTATNQSTGGGKAHNNLPPYIVVYMWKRTE